MANKLKCDDIYEKVYKITVVGSPNVGKSNIITKYVNDVFTYKSPTMGLEFYSKITYKTGTPNKQNNSNDKSNDKSNKIKIQIWDTAGQERYNSLAPIYYRSSDGVLLVFDLDDYESFININSYLTETIHHSKTDVSVILVGAKSDQFDRSVDPSEINDFCKLYDMKYIETSAKMGYNINHLFDTIINQIEDKNYKKELMLQEIKNSTESANKPRKLSSSFMNIPCSLSFNMSHKTESSNHLLNHKPESVLIKQIPSNSFNIMEPIDVIQHASSDSVLKIDKSNKSNKSCKCNCMN